MDMLVESYSELPQSLDEPVKSGKPPSRHLGHRLGHRLEVAARDPSPSKPPVGNPPLEQHRN